MTEAADRYRRFLDRLSFCPGYGPHLTLIAVSKTKPVEDILSVFQAGQSVFGENRVQEARDKQSSLPADIDFHLLGPLQKNKVKYCPGLFSTVHSLDSLQVAQLLNEKCESKGHKIRVLFQMNLTNEGSKSGFTDVAVLSDVLGEVCKMKNIEPIGLMTIPNPNLSAVETGKIFSMLRDNLVKLSAEHDIKGTFRELSMGMTDDFDIAIAEGSTMIRVGSAIFGSRPYPIQI